MKNVPSIKSKSSFPMTKMEPARFLESIYRLSTDSQHEAILLYLQEQFERIEKAESGARHWREYAGKQDAQLKASNEDGRKMQTMYHEAVAAYSQAIDERNKIDRQAQEFSEEISSAFRKHGLAAGPTALDRIIAERDKLSGYYREIVNELGDDLALKRIRDLTQQLDEVRKERDDSRAVVDKLGRMAEFAQQANDAASEKEVALSATFAEAMAQEMLAQTEAELEEARKARDLAEAKARWLDLWP
jgi:hypothetical protein